MSVDTEGSKEDDRVVHRAGNNYLCTDHSDKFDLNRNFGITNLDSRRNQTNRLNYLHIVYCHFDRIVYLNLHKLHSGNHLNRSGIKIRELRKNHTSKHYFQSTALSCFECTEFELDLPPLNKPW